MKRQLIISLLLLSLYPLAAQTDSAVWVGDTGYDSVVYSAPRKNPIYYFGSPFCEHFAELKAGYGNGSLGLGLNYTYLPEVWGAHLSGYWDGRSRWLVAGAEYRLSKPWNSLDWHLYGSAGICQPVTQPSSLRPAAEVGIRLADSDRSGKFCYTSGTIGVMTDFDRVFVTVGIGLSVSLLFSTLILLI
ncbi:MAG: hypothetical protein IJM33_06175 [Bacteroidales bacterium]|nr:hypothetical protein [Bacteroidales bacterium]